MAAKRHLTIRLKKELLEQLKYEAYKKEVSLTYIIENRLKNYLKPKE
jgi:predicted HicB family RNase H-like nuclease